MNNIKEIISRLKQHYTVENNRELALKIDVSYETLNTWIKRKKIPLEKIHEIVQNEQLSYDWFFTGVNNSKNNNSDIKIKGDNNNTTGHGSTTLNGGININNVSVNPNIQEIVQLLQFAPEEFLNTVKDRLKKFKDLTRL